MRSWERALGDGFERIHYGKDLQEFGMNLRRTYLDWIAALGKTCEGLTWWSSRLAERNTQVYSPFHDICYLKVVRSFVARQDCPLLIIAESKPLLRTIALQREWKERVQWTRSLFPLGDWIVWGLHFSFVWTRYFIRALLEIRDARKTRKGQRAHAFTSRKERVVMHSCVDESFFGEDGIAYDRYFTSLPGKLRELGYEVVTIPWLFNLLRSRREAFAWFRQHPDHYLIPEDYYSLMDYAWAAWIVVQQAQLLRGEQRFDGQDVTLFVREVNRRGAVDTGIARFVRYIRLIRKLKQRNFKIKVFIDKFENMTTEKPQLLGLQTYMPEVLRVGFQHYLAPYPLLLNMFAAAEEVARAPYPDVIVCNSAFTASLFAQEGFPEERLKIGPSLRYLHLTQSPHVDRSDGKDVLVVLSLHPAVAAEVMDKLLDGFPNDEGFRFLLKMHPMMSKHEWRLVVGNRALPVHMIEVEGEMDHWIPKVTCAVVAPATTAGLELLLAGVPIAMMGRETDFDMNPLAWFQEFDRPVYSTEELRTVVLRMLSSNKDHDFARRWALRYRQHCLSPLNEDTTRVFVDPSSSNNRKNSLQTSAIRGVT
jgi:hypothetical protein